MKNGVFKNNGIGFLFLLFAIAFIAFLLWGFFLVVREGESGRDIPQQDLEIIDRAKTLKEDAELRDRQIMGQ